MAVGFQQVLGIEISSPDPVILAIASVAFYIVLNCLDGSFLTQLKSFGFYGLLCRH